MFSVITNIYNKKAKGPTLMEWFTATGKLNFFFTTRDVRCVHHVWHGTHRYDIQDLVTQASTCVHRYSSLLQWSVALSQRDHVTMLLCVFCMKCTLHSNHRFTRVIFQHTKPLLPPERPFFHYIHSHHLAVEMWNTIKNELTGKKKILSCSFYLYRFRKYMSYGFSIINFCNPGVHYEMACIRFWVDLSATKRN